MSCLEKLKRGYDSSMIVGPVPCLSGSESGPFVYVVCSGESMEVVSTGCMVVGTGGEIPSLGSEFSFGETVKRFEDEREVSLRWDLGSTSKICADCEVGGGKCWFDLERNHSFCETSSHHGNILFYFILNYICQHMQYTVTKVKIYITAIQLVIPYLHQLN